MTEKHYKMLTNLIDEKYGKGMHELVIETEIEKRNIYGKVVKLYSVVTLKFKGREKVFRLKDYNKSLHMYEDIVKYIKEEF